MAIDVAMQKIKDITNELNKVQDEKFKLCPH